MNATDTTKPKTKKVGVLLVHGVGEQCQFEHLEGEARNIATTLRKSAAKINGNYIAEALKKKLENTSDPKLNTALKAAKEQIKKGNIATALKELAFPLKKDYIAEFQKLADEIEEDIKLKNILKLAANKSKKGNIVRIIEELVTEIKDPNIQQIIKKLEDKIKTNDITPLIEALVDQIPDLTRFELAELAAKKLANKAQVVQIAVNSFPSAAFGAKQETWHDGERAPVMVEVYDEENEKITRITQIYFHQVWWADLDEPTTLGSEIRFWLWGLSLWTIKGKFKTGLPGSGRMYWPNNSQKTIGCWARISLFWVSLVILLILPVLSLLKFVFRGLLDINIPRPDILAQFIGDVKLFQQEKRIGKGPLQDLGLPPRVTLRRRMLRAMVEMALHRYDRWYILAHSQGTVLAFNGIMETAQSLPNYLTQELWSRCRVNYLIRKAQTDCEKLKEDEKRKMQPSFPSWRDKDCILDRRVLFEDFRGLLTYGSPLNKFATLWPAIVPLNKDSHVFDKDFQWLNVYDPTDPVAGKTHLFKPNPDLSQSTEPERITYKTAEPIDFAYKANRFHLLSHLEYLTSNEGDRPRLVDIVANWLLEGNLTVNEDEGSLTVDKLTVKRGDSGWPNPLRTNFYRGFRVTTWLFAALVIGSLLSVIISASPQLSSYFQPKISFAFSIIPPWLHLSMMALWFKWVIATIFFIGVFSIAISLIVGTRFLWGGFVLGVLTTAVITVLYSTIQEQLLNIILTTLLEGSFYILLGVIGVFIIGVVVRIFVKDLGKL